MFIVMYLLQTIHLINQSITCKLGEIGLAMGWLKASLRAGNAKASAGVRFVGKTNGKKQKETC